MLIHHLWKGSEGHDLTSSWKQHVNLTYIFPLCSFKGTYLLYICTLSIHWQIYWGNFHLWWACFYIWLWGAFRGQNRRRESDMKTDLGYTVCVIHMKIYSLFTQSITTSSSSSSPAGLPTWCCQMDGKTTSYWTLALVQNQRGLSQKTFGKDATATPSQAGSVFELELIHPFFLYLNILSAQQRITTHSSTPA